MQSNETKALAEVSNAIDAGDLEYAGFWIRVGAALIDSILLLLIITPLLIKFYGWTYFSADAGSNAYVFVKGPSDFIISYLVPAIISIAFWMTKQATPGKMLLKLKIVDAKTGNPLTLGQSIGRYLGYYVSIIPFCLGLIWVGIDSKKQGWHDKLAGTVVVRSKKRGTEAVKFQ